MDQHIYNNLWRCDVGEYTGGNTTKNYYNILLLQDKEREFVVTHHADIKPVSYFTGRETELKELRQRIEEGRKSVLVSGMGGIGKTHICRKLFEEYYIRHDAEDGKGSFCHIGYIEYNGDMGSSLQHCLKYKKQEQEEANLEAAWRELEYLASEGSLLLFIDNVDKSGGEDPGLERLNTIPGAIILTSRQVSFSDAFEPYRIGFLEREQCIAVYERIRFDGSERKISAQEIPDLEYVIEKLAGRHTITVEHLAHLARTKTWTVKKLREQLIRNGFRLQFHKNGELINIQQSYEALYDLSKLTEAEQNILEAFSLFPYLSLAAETCNEWMLADAGASEDDDILIGLYQKGWLQFDISQESYALHPVFAQFIYEKCKPGAEMHRGLIAACKNYLEVPESGLAFECQTYIPFAESIVEKLHLEDDIEQVSFIFALGYLLYYIAEYEKAGELYKKIRRTSERVLGEEHPLTAMSYNNLASVYDRRGEYGRAEELYKKGLEIRERVLGEEHPDTARSYNNLAGVYERQGEYKKAEELYKKALGIRERLLGEGHLITVISYDNLAGLYERRGEYKKAEELYKKGLRIREQLLGKEHVDTATSYSNLAGLYERRGEYKKAEELYKKGLEIRERVLGEGHLLTTMSNMKLAFVYVKQGKYKKVEEMYEEGLRTSERILGEEHVDTASIYNNFAVVYEGRGEYKKAEELYKKGLSICKRVLGEEHPNTATCYDNLATIYSKQGGV